MGATGSFLGKKDPVRELVYKLQRYAGSRLDCIEILETMYKVLHPRVGSGAAAQVHFVGRKGCQTLMETINFWKEDEVVVRCCVRALLPVCSNEVLAEDLRRVGVRTCLEEMLDIFKLDEFITEDGTKALDVINTEGRKVANAKMEEGYQTENVVLIFEAMIEHPKKKDINETALTRLWDLTRKKEQTPAQIIEHDGQETIAIAIKFFPAHAGVQKKACAVVSSASACLPFMALMGKQDVIKCFVDAYNKFGNDFDVQQQVLWAMDALAQIDSNVERMDRDGLKLILRNLYKDERKRTETKKKDADKSMLWRLVPVRLKRMWTKTQLFAEYVPTPPNADLNDPDWGNDGTMHYDLKVQKISRDKYRKFDWDPDAQWDQDAEKPLLLAGEKNLAEEEKAPDYPSQWFANS